MVAGQIAAAATMADRSILLDYSERRLAEGDGSDALSIWNTLCRRNLFPTNRWTQSQALMLPAASLIAHPLKPDSTGDSTIPPA